ncbi:MAG: hypothetical protein NTY23_12550, partial [Chloroflexi bacterium]|nr:hypothetical protein [Chloroflexota bacterium]
MNDHVGIPQPVQRIGRRLYDAAYRQRLPVAYAAYGLVAAGAYALACWIDFDFRWHSGYAATFL